MQQQSPVEADSRPLIVVAEREQVPEPGSGLMDLAVLGYRLRWRLAGWWVLFFAGSVMLMPLRSGFTWRLTVQLRDQVATQVFPQDQVRSEVRAPTEVPTQTLEPLLVEWSFAGAGFDGVRHDYFKVGAGSKPEVLRTGLVASMESASGSEPPEAMVALRSIAGQWCERQAVRWQEMQRDTIAIAIKRRDAIIADMPRGGGSVELAAAELAVAQAESAARFPPECNISGLEPQPKSSGGLWALAQRAALCLVGSIAIALALHGWSRVRAAARSQPG